MIRTLALVTSIGALIGIFTGSLYKNDCYPINTPITLEQKGDALESNQYIDAILPRQF